MALVLHELQPYGLFSFCICYYCLIPFLCCIKLCMFKNFHLMPHWTCPLQTFAVDTAKSFFQPYSTATFLQLHIFSMENALNNDYFEELFPVSVWSLRPPSRYSIVWKLSLGNYLCYVKALDTRMQKFNSMFTLRPWFLITTSFTLVAALQLSLLCMWMENLNSLFERHSNFRTHFKFSLPNLNLLMWLQLRKRSLTPGAILMTYSSYS